MLRPLREPIPLRKSRLNQKKSRPDDDEIQTGSERKFSSMLHHTDRTSLGRFPGYKTRCVNGGDGRSRTYDTADMSRML